MKKLLAVTFAILTLGLIPVFVSFGGDWASTDFINQQIPFILETKRMFASGAPWWSWNTFAGDNFIGAYSFYTLTSPFVWLICLFPASGILTGILIALYLKTLCTAVFSFVYFRKMGFTAYRSALGATLYCFSSFYICNLFYFHFCEPIMMFPLLLTAIETVVRGRRRCWLWLALATFGVVFINFYFALPSLSLGALYLLFRSHAERRLSFPLILKSAGAVVLGIGLSSFILIPAVLHNMGGIRSQINITLPENIGMAITDLLTRLRILVMPTVSEFPTPGFATTSFWNSQHPFITLFGCLPAVIYVCRHRDWLSRLLILLSVIYFTPLNGIFSAFTDLQYMRWLYGLDIFMILTVLKETGDPVRISARQLYRYITATVIIIALCFLTDYLKGNSINLSATYPNRTLLSLILFIVNATCLAAVVIRRLSLKRIIILASLCGCLNLAATATVYTVRQAGDDLSSDIYRRDVFTILETSGDNHDGRPAEIHFRTDVLTNFRNYSLISNTPGLYGFNSSINKRMNLLKTNVLEYAVSPTFAPMRFRETLDILFSVKEVIDFGDTLIYSTPFINTAPTINPMEKIRSGKDREVYRMKNYIPMGFAYESYVTYDDILPLVPYADSIDVPRILLEHIALKAEDIPRLTDYLPPTHTHLKNTHTPNVPQNPPYSKNLKNPKDPKDLKDLKLIQTLTSTLDSIVKERNRHTAKNFIGTTDGFTCETDFSRPTLLFFSIPADPGFTAHIDGRPTPIYEANLGLMAIPVPEGHRHIRVTYRPPGLRTGLLITLISLLLLLLILILPLLRHTPES